MPTRKLKILNDPVYGFVSLTSERLFDLIEHPYVQRLRRIRQMGLSELVYPGALHTRFHHAIGAMHLMRIALDSLRYKGREISEQEYESAQIAILLHDLGHGPFSHALEFSLLEGVQHEKVSLLLMKKLSAEFGGALDTAIEMFSGTYPRPFFHQLISSQLDIDRLDYLQRDCYFTGVTEGQIGAQRIIKLLDVENEALVVEEKGIYSVENFLNARRLMYWQVYLHKASLSGEQMLISALMRAKWLASQGDCPPGSVALTYFLSQSIEPKTLARDPQALDHFLAMDDYDLWMAIKTWEHHPDPILSLLCGGILHRKLFRIHLSDKAPSGAEIKRCEKKIEATYPFGTDTAQFLLLRGKVSNKGYMAGGEKIFIRTKTGEIKDIADASDLPNIKAISKVVKKHFLAYPKGL